jgi:hypothetical protein
MMTMPFVQCRNSVEGQWSLVDGQLLWGPTIALGPLLVPSVVPYS